MINLTQLIKTNNISYKIRNFLKLRPNLYVKPNNKNSPISDFFYWRNDKKYSTQFALMNIGSHILPQLKQKDNVTILIYKYNGKLLKSLNFKLNDMDTIKVDFKIYDLQGSGSFFIFHNFKNKDFLNSNNTFVTERGYVGYKKNDHLWNYMHGNHNAAYLDSNKNIKSLMPISFFYNEYIPQTRFDDVNKFKLIFNNVNKSTIKINIEIFGVKDSLIEKKSYTCKYLNTLEIPFLNKNFNIKFLKITSNLLFCRPIIFKEYDEGFDIYHG